MFEGALAGLGGCPFAPGAPGNQDIIALADFIGACGFKTTAERAALGEASRLIRLILTNDVAAVPVGTRS